MTCIIMRGVPGSGKSYHARSLEAYAKKQSTIRASYEFDTKIVSADSYHIDEETGEYHYDPAKAGEAHADCFKKADTFLRNFSDGVSLLIVDNTNLRSWELHPYVMLARLHGHSVSSRLVLCNLEDCLREQTHGVPESRLYQMMKSIDPPTPGLKELVIQNFGHRG